MTYTIAQQNPILIFAFVEEDVKFSILSKKKQNLKTKLKFSDELRCKYCNST